jgi:hypothetical protein
MKWHLLVKSVAVLDAPTLAHWQAEFERLEDLSRSWILGSVFMFVLVADEIGLSVIEPMSEQGFGLFGVARWRGGGGKALIASVNSKQVYGSAPTLPYDARTYTSEAINALKRILGNAGQSNLAHVAGPREAAGLNLEPRADRLAIFVSYSREDEAEKERIIAQLRPLERVGVINVWHDAEIGWGENLARRDCRCDPS